MRTAFKAALLVPTLGMMIMAVSATGAASKPKMLKGTWGGDRMILTMSASGGQIDMDCASGTIKGKIVPDAKGNFTVRGTFDQERGGPTLAEDFAHKGKPAIYRGQIIGNTIKLAITQNGVTQPTNYVLREGERPKLVRCL
jgi:hypothetical protein